MDQWTFPDFTEKNFSSRKIAETPQQQKHMGANAPLLYLYLTLFIQTQTSFFLRAKIYDGVMWLCH